jgi:Holliday junction resolvase-like predicted endonuclease
MDNYNIEYYRSKAECLLTQINDGREFLSHHKPSLGFWGEHLLRGFLRENLPNDVKVTQGFVTLDEDFDSIRQKLYFLTNKKEDDVEYVFSDSISPQCDIILYRNNVVKSFGEIDIVNAKDVVCVIEVKCSIGRKSFERTNEIFKRLQLMGVDKKYLFIYNSPLLGTLKSYFFPKQSAEKQDDFVVIDDTNMIYDHGIEAYLPSGIIGVNQNYILCQDYVVDGRDQFGYIAYRLTKEKASLSCLQLFLSSLYQNIEEGEVVSKKPFNMEFDGMTSDYSFGLYDL